MSVKEALKLLRLETGMTQTDLAERLNKTFLTVNRWENGKGFPSRRSAKDILYVAEKSGASKECISYLNEVLMPEIKRDSSAATYGFPDIDKEFMFQIADGSSNSLYVIEAGTYNLLYANRKAEKSAVKFLSDIGEKLSGRRINEQNDKRCFHYFANRNEPCPFCSLKSFDSKGYKDITMIIPDSGRTLNVHAKKSKMNNREVYIIYLTDVTEKNAEKNALYELTNDIPFGVGIYNIYIDGSIELAFMNTNFYNMIGNDRENAVLRKKTAEFRLIKECDKERLSAEIKQSIHKKRNIDIDLSMLLADRKFHLIHITGRMLNKDHEKFTYYCVFIDKTVSEREALHEFQA